MKAVNVNKAVIGIENNKPDAIAHLTKLAAAYPGIEIMPLKVQYPQGGEKQLIDAVIRRQVKSGALPISAGAVVQNVGTAYAVYEAVQKNKPLFERVVTVTGKAVANPSNFLVRMGTPINTLIEAAGGIPENTGKIIGGGPMMGKALVSAEVPVTKGSSGVLLLTKEESVRKPMKDCIRCAKCVNVCPMGLNPAFLMKFTVYKDWEKPRPTTFRTASNVVPVAILVLPTARCWIRSDWVKAKLWVLFVQESHKTRAIWKTNYTCLPRPTFMAATA